MSEKERLELEQAKLLDGDMEKFKRKYLGQYIAYYNHLVLATGRTAEETLSRIPNDKRSLPWVMRLISEQTEVYNGGPRSA